MKCLCNVHCKYFKDIDMFGKEPEIYYKGESKKTSWMGRIFTILFALSYFAFVLYKVIRMMRKIDVTFYDTYTYATEPSKVKITNENFYGGFALENPRNFEAFIDESIYIPKASFTRIEEKGFDDFSIDKVDLELEPCKVEKFGSKYQAKFKTKKMSQFYCFKNMDFFLEGHFTYGLYSNFLIQFFPCVNTTESQKCKPLEEIDMYLKNTFVSLQWQDIELNPKNYSYPTKPRDLDIHKPIGKKFFNDIHVYFQVVNIETDMDFIGFDEFENIRTDTYLKFDEIDIMNKIIENDIYEAGESICDLTIELSENVRMERRTYIKLLTILGDIGGFMEVIFTLFRVFCSFSVDILYDISLVNNLFDFNLDKKIIMLKEKKRQKKEINNIMKNETPNIYSLKNSNTFFINSDKVLGSEKRIKEDTTRTNRLNINNQSTLVFKLMKKNIRFKERYSHRPHLDKNSITKNNLHTLKKNNEINELELDRFDLNNISNQQDEQREGKIIRKIKMSRAWLYICFLCVRRRKIIQNVLLDEGMNIISNKLDIFNIFDSLCMEEKINEKLWKHECIEMSDECKARLERIKNMDRRI